MSEFVFPENAIVRREFIQLFTRASGTGVLVQHSIRTINRIRILLINLKLGFFRFSVVVKKQFLLKILIIYFFEFLIPECKFHASYYISCCDLSSSAVSFTLLQIRHFS